MKKLLMLIVVLLFLVASPLNAATLWEMNFDASGDWIPEYQVLETGCIPAAGRAEVTHVTTDCYSGGCMKVVPPKGVCAGNGNGGIGGVGNLSYTAANEVHFRFLIKFGSTFNSMSSGGVIKFLLADFPDRDGILGLIECTSGTCPESNYMCFGPSAADGNYAFCDPDTCRGWVEDCPENARITAARHPGWIAVEYYVNNSANEVGIYMWSQNGLLNGYNYHVHSSVPYNNSGFYISYYNGYGTADANNYYLLDSLKVADSYIGPPAGFVGGADTTAPAVTISTTDPSTIYADSLSISGTASDAVGVTSCKYRIGSAPDATNGTALTGTTSWSGTATGFSYGANTLYVGCTDAAGNWGSDSITVNYNHSYTGSVTMGTKSFAAPNLRGARFGATVR
jgi:hypothetical protein